MTKKKLITIQQYEKMMEKIIDKKMTVSETLIEMLNKASNYEIKEEKRKQK